MRKFPLILDLETKYTFRQFAEHKKLGISVAAVFDYKDRETKTFREDEISRLFPYLEHASYIIGFNILSFDLPVLQPYYPGDISHFSTFDLLDDIKKILGRRLALNDLVSTTLGKKKTGHGLMAIDLYKEKKWDELIKYCQEDVLLTKELFEYGIRNGEIFYLDEKGRNSIKVNWRRFLEEEGKTETPLTLPF